MSPPTAGRVLSRAWAPLLVFVLHVVLDRGLDVYAPWPWLDGPMHVGGGLAIAYFLAGAIDVVRERAPVSPPQAWLDLALVFTAAGTAAIVWELAEFVVDRTFGTNLQVSLPNTMKDFAMGLLGAATLVAGRVVKGRQAARLRRRPGVRRRA